MAVREADKAIDEWLTNKISQTRKLVEASTIEVEAVKSSIIAHKHHDLRSGYLMALEDTQRQLHEFWGASLDTEDSNEEKD